MKTLLAAAALASLAACATVTGGPRADWRCDGGAAFSVRLQETSAEVFAGGRVYELPAVQSGYSDGAVTYRESGGGATLEGAHGGPYTNCRRS